MLAVYITSTYLHQTSLVNNSYLRDDFCANSTSLLDSAPLVWAKAKCGVRPLTL